VEVTQFEKLDGSAQLIHLVNGSGHFGNTFYAPLTISDVQVVAPCPQRPWAVRGLRADQALDFAWADGRLSVRVPQLTLFEAVYVEIGE
jgi:hypothetical protein